jgi:hypothetical protein
MIICMFGASASLCLTEKGYSSAFPERDSGGASTEANSSTLHSIQLSTRARGERERFLINSNITLPLTSEMRKIVNYIEE